MTAAAGLPVQMLTLEDGSQVCNGFFTETQTPCRRNGRCSRTAPPGGAATGRAVGFRADRYRFAVARRAAASAAACPFSAALKASVSSVRARASRTCAWWVRSWACPRSVRRLLILRAAAVAFATMSLGSPTTGRGADFRDRAAVLAKALAAIRLAAPPVAYGLGCQARTRTCQAASLRAPARTALRAPAIGGNRRPSHRTASERQPADPPARDRVRDAASGSPHRRNRRHRPTSPRE